LCLVRLANFAEGLFVFVHSTFITKWEVLRELKIISQCLLNGIKELISARLMVSQWIKERVCSTCFALKTLLTLPLTFWDSFQWRA